MPHITDIACVAGVVCRAKTARYMSVSLECARSEASRGEAAEAAGRWIILLLRVMPSTHHGLAFCFDCIALTTVCFRATANPHATPSLVGEGGVMSISSFEHPKENTSFTKAAASRCCERAGYPGFRSHSDIWWRNKQCAMAAMIFRR